MKKKGIFFSTDALIALIIIILVLIVTVPMTFYSNIKTEVHSDLMIVLSTLTVGEIDTPQIRSMISSGEITNPNNTIIEQIGIFYVTNKTKAKIIADEVISNLDVNENIGIWFENQMITSKNTTPFENASNIQIERQVISGLIQGNSTTGFAARAYLSSDVQTDFFYFGGYVGDGNLSTIVSYNGSIISAELELAINNNFSVFVNGINIGNFSSSASDVIPSKYNLSTNNFQSGDNLIEIKGKNLYISGGFVKIIYMGFSENFDTQYKFPGINGLINLYDGFYNENLNSLDIFLKLNTSYEVFLNIGNKTVYKNYTNGEESINIGNSYLSSILNYQEISNKTIPIRLGISNSSYISNFSLNVHTFSVTDLSGSMADSCNGGSFWCCLSSGNFCSTQSTCNSCGGTWEQKITLAKQANNAFIDGILNSSGNKVGLAGYKTTASNNDFHNLSTNNISLKAEVNSWTASGRTCICCGINKGVQGINFESGAGVLEALVVMSDGEATDQCSQQGTGNAKTDAIQAACDAYLDHNIKVYTVGFGSDADENTLQQIADCGNGTYYYGDTSEIVELYETIAEDILKASFSEQTINITGTFNETIIYPESHINITSSSSSIIPSGVVLTLEKIFDNSTTGTFSIPENSTVLSAKVVSYSGSKWTNNLKLNGINIYNLSQYGSTYTSLGDPYVIDLPLQYIQQNNIIELNTALSPTNTSAGSSYNKIIYKIQKNSSSYSSISPYFDGCTWTIEFEDNTNATIKIPADYNGSSVCYYTSSMQAYDSNDAMQEAVYKLLKVLDLNSNNKLDIKLTEGNLQITSNEISGIPFVWSTEAQIRIWT